MKKPRTILIVICLIIIILSGKFVYNNIIVPWPYRHEPRACVDAADVMQTQKEIENTRNTCFRTYPHFL